MESEYAYPERSADNLAAACVNAKAETDVRVKHNIMVFLEVSRGHSKPATSCPPNQTGKGRGLTKGRRAEC
jgi:hypothetical protein